MVSQLFRVKLSRCTCPEEAPGKVWHYMGGSSGNGIYGNLLCGGCGCTGYIRNYIPREHEEEDCDLEVAVIEP